MTFTVQGKFMSLPALGSDMGLTKNVGGLDRVARTVLGIGLLIVTLRSLTSGRRSTALVAAVSAAGLLFNATTQFCGLNAALGIDTCSRE